MLEKLLKAHPCCGVLDKHPLHKILCLFGDFFGELQGSFEALFDLVVGQLIGPEEGGASEEHLVGDDAQAPDIAFFIVLLPLEDLRRHRQRRPHDGAKVLVFGMRPREAEVC